MTRKKRSDSYPKSHCENVCSYTLHKHPPAYRLHGAMHPTLANAYSMCWSMVWASKCQARNSSDKYTRARHTNASSLTSCHAHRTGSVWHRSGCTRMVVKKWANGVTSKSYRHMTIRKYVRSPWVTMLRSYPKNANSGPTSKSKRITRRPGLIYATYGYMYGAHKWSVIINCVSQFNFYTEDFTGAMMVGVINNKSRSSKVYGQLVPFTLERGKTRITVQLETEKQRLTIFTPNSAKGEVVSDLPKGGIFVPAILNKTQKLDRNLKILARLDFITIQ